MSALFTQSGCIFGSFVADYHINVVKDFHNLFKIAKFHDFSDFEPNLNFCIAGNILTFDMKQPKKPQFEPLAINTEF